MNYNNNPGLLLTFLLTGMVFISIISTSGNILGIDIKALPVKPVFAKEDILFEFRITSTKGHKRAISFSLLDNEINNLDILKGFEEKISFRLKSDNRGIFHPGPLKLSTIFPLGIFEAKLELDTKTAGLVYPFPVPGPPDESQGFATDEEIGRTHISSNGDFSELRSYIPGDPLHRIAWKASARGHGLLTKDFKENVKPSVILDLNSIPRNDMEYRLSRLCYMVLEADKKDIPYGLKLLDQIIKPGQGQSHKIECLNALAVFGIKDSIHF